MRKMQFRSTFKKRLLDAFVFKNCVQQQSDFRDDRVDLLDVLLLDQVTGTQLTGKQSFRINQMPGLPTQDPRLAKNYGEPVL